MGTSVAYWNERFSVCSVYLNAYRFAQLRLGFFPGRVFQRPSRLRPTAEAHTTEAYENTLTRFAPERQGTYEAKALDVVGWLEGAGESE